MARLWLTALLLQGCFYVTDEEYAARWDLDGDGVERPLDCDDDDPDVQLRTWHLDGDGDGYGGADTVEACAQPDGAVDNGDDCDDADPERHPGAPEVCNEVDDDCDQEVDEDAGPVSWYADTDGDGFGDAASVTVACEPVAGHVQNGDDCDDAVFEINPDALELCNGVDDDCDEQVDLADPDLDPAVYTWSVDGDGDGWGEEGGITVEACDPPSGYGPMGDCRDDLFDVNPDALEVCDNVDNDCDGATDGIDAVACTDQPDLPGCAPTWFEDVDGDGFGVSTSTIAACTEPPGYAEVALDCDDTDEDVNLAQPEICANGVDDDCDTLVDDLDDTCISDTATPDTGP